MWGSGGPPRARRSPLGSYDSLIQHLPPPPLSLPSCIPHRKLNPGPLPQGPGGPGLLCRIGWKHSDAETLFLGPHLPPTPLQGPLSGLPPLPSPPYRVSTAQPWKHLLLPTTMGGCGPRPRDRSGEAMEKILHLALSVYAEVKK